MDAQFSHQDVQRHWADALVDVPIEHKEFDQFCFSDEDSENHIEIFRASNDAFPDVLSFWIAAAKQALIDGTKDGERWVSEYLSGGDVSRLSADEFRQWLSRYTDTLLPEHVLDLPEPTDDFVRVWLNHMDDALVGPVPTGFWALRWHSTA